jgi:hypothetical protein
LRPRQYAAASFIVFTPCVVVLAIAATLLKANARFRYDVSLRRARPQMAATWAHTYRDGSLPTRLMSDIRRRSGRIDGRMKLTQGSSVQEQLLSTEDSSLS